MRQGGPVGVGVGLHPVEGHAELVVEEILQIEEYGEDADGTRDGVGLGHDGVAAHRHVVAARGRHVRHRRDDGLLLAGQLDFAPHHVRGQGAAARRVDAQNHGLDLIILADFTQFFHERI